MPNLCSTPPDFTLPIYDSADTYTLSSHANRVVLLLFTNIYCSHCWHFWDRMNALRADFATAGNVDIVMVMFNTSAAAVSDAMIDKELADRGKAPPSFTLLKDGGSGGVVAAAWGTGFSVSLGFPYGYLISRDDFIVDKWNRNSTANGETLSFDSSDDDDVENFIRHRVNDLLTDRPRWNTILTLDCSGTMAMDVTVHGVTKPKIEFLKDAVDSWLRVWKDYALCGDKLGVVTFQDEPSTDGLLRPVLPGTSVEEVLDLLDTLPAQGCTAMGAGIATGIDLLETEPIDPDDPHERYMVVFTDGIQNRNPMVIQTADCGGGSCVWQPQIRNISDEEANFNGWYFCGLDGGLSHYDGALPRILDLNPMRTTIHTIGIGPPDIYAELLHLIAETTSGTSYVDSEVWPNLEEFFLESLVETFRGSSLAVVAKASATLLDSEPQDRHCFRLNRSVRKVTILLSWLDESNPLAIAVYKDGEKLNLANKLSTKPRKQIATLPFPLYQPARRRLALGRVSAVDMLSASSPAQWQLEGHEISAEGEFEIVVKRGFADMVGPVPYNLTVLADDSRAEVELRLPRQVYYTGEPIPLDIVVSERGRPLRDVFSATVEVKRPLVSFANLVLRALREVRLHAAKAETDSQHGPYQAAVTALMANTRAMEKLREFDVSRVALRPDYHMEANGKVGQKGLFRGQFASTKVPGHYRLQARVRAVSETCGVFERLVTKTVLVLPRPSFEHSDLRIHHSAHDKTLTIRMSPADEYGNLLGPGFAHLMVLALDDVPSGRVKDNLNGSYEVEIQHHDGDERLLSLWIAGERLVHEPFHQIVHKSRR